MTIYKPYFYIIQEISTGMYYAGAKWAEGANPINFMIEGGYSTSSNVIKHIINRDGLSAFKIRKIRIFENAKQAEIYEKKFLSRIDAANHPMFYNQHNGDLLQAYQSDSYKFYMKSVYGVEHPMQCKNLYDKSIATKLEKYGNVNNHEQTKKTNLEKYGVENVYQSMDIQEKIKDIHLERLGVPYPMMNEEVKEKSRLTSLDKYGTENPMQSEDIRNMQKNNNLEKYGVENIFQTDFAKEKSKQTMLDKYGVEHPMYSEKIKSKLKKTNLEKYGVENAFQSDIAREKMKKLLSRSELDIIRKYQKKYKLTFGSGWSRRSDEYIKNLLKGLIDEYGEII